jgi:hypothetical protein
MVVLVPQLQCTQLPSWVSIWLVTFVPALAEHVQLEQRPALSFVVEAMPSTPLLSCLAEYLTAEVLELAGNASKDLKVRRAGLLRRCELCMRYPHALQQCCSTLHVTAQVLQLLILVVIAVYR